MARVIVMITVRDSERIGWFSGLLQEIRRTRRSTSESAAARLQVRPRDVTVTTIVVVVTVVVTTK